MAEVQSTSKINHDHTYDILTALMNICPSSPETDDLFLDITSPQPSDTSSDSGLALSPMEFGGFDIDFTDTSSLENFDFETIASSCPTTPTDQFLENIGDINDIDLSFLDGLDPKILASLPEITEKIPLQENTTPQDLESIVKMINADDEMAMDEGIDMTPLPASPPPPTETKLPAMKTIATVTPIVITEIKPVQSIPAKIESKKSGILLITEEEKKLLEEEGHVLPVNVALTKDEEKLLKKVRRKIKNKVSAQESRKKKKEYVDGLELRVKCSTDQNRLLQKKVASLEEQNKSLMEQLKNLQELVSTSTKSKKQTSTCILVLFLAFALVAFPFNAIGSPKDTAVADSYATLPVRSRTLLQYNEEKEPPSALNISHYLRAFSIVFSFSSDSPEIDSYSTPTISFDDGRHMNDESFTQEYAI